MKKGTFYLLLGFSSIFAGGIFFCIYHEWLVIYWNKPSTALAQTGICTQKKVSISWWNHTEWHTEEVNILWPEQKIEALKNLVAKWIVLNQEEGTVDQRLFLESILSSPSGQELYISFDRSPLSKEWSAHTKLLCIESLLKTIRDNHFTYASVHFLVHHQPFTDYHLDFSVAWPLTGFLESHA